MFLRKWLMVMLAACALACGCSTFNTNLTTQTNSSTITFVTPARVQAGSQPDGLPCPSSGTCFTLTVMGSTFYEGAEIQITNSAGQTTLFQTCSGTATGTTCAVPACISVTATECTTFVSTTELQATLSAADVADVGTLQVAVRIPGSAVTGASGAESSGTTELSNLVLFNVSSAPVNPPTIASNGLSPSQVAAGSAAFTLTVTGTGFVTGANASVLYWIAPGGLGTALATTVNSVTSLSAPIPASYVACPGSANVSVSDAPSGGGVSQSATFTITGTTQCPDPASKAGTAAAALAEGLAGASPTVFGLGSVASAVEPGISANGRYVVFAMASTDGVTEQPGSTQNVFVRDTCAGASSNCTPSTSLVSVGIDGHAGDADSISPSISANGRYIAFVSAADNLIADDVNGVADVFVRDTCAGAPSGCTPGMQRVSVATDGAPANYASQAAAISASGRYITFQSQATNLDPSASTGSSGFSGIFVHDTCVGAPAASANTAACTPSTHLLNLQN